MSTFGIKIGHFNPRLYNRIYCVIPGVEMSPNPSFPLRGGNSQVGNWDMFRNFIYT